MLIDFGYVWNEVWVEKYENGVTFYGILLILASLGLLMLNILMIYLNIKEFWISSCYFNKISIVFAIIALAAFICIVFLKLNEQSSILTAFFVSLLYTYLSGYALNSQNSKQCNPQNKVDKWTEYVYGFLFHIMINLLLGYITVVFASVSESSSEAFQKAGMDNI